MMSPTDESGEEVEVSTDQGNNGDIEQPTPVEEEALNKNDAATISDNTMDAKQDDEDEPDLKYRWKPGHIPETESWFPANLFFGWVAPLFQRAAYLHKQEKALQHDDLLPLPPMDKGASVGPIFEDSWDRELERAANKRQTLIQKGKAEDVPEPRLTLNQLGKGKGPTTHNLPRALYSVMGKRFLLAGLVKIVNTGLQFSFPLLLNQLLQFIEEAQAGLLPADAPWDVKYAGYWLSAVLFCFMASKAVTENTYFHMMYRSGYQARVAVSVAVYNKALRLANAERQDTTLGELINLMQVDASKIEMFIPQIHVLWDGMLQICGYMTILYTLIGWPCFAGLAIMIAAGPIQGVIMGKMFGRNHLMAKFTDQRVKTTNEALQGIQGVKMYTWEESFAKSIAEARATELGHLKAIAYLRAFSRAYMSALPGIVAVVSFVVYVVAIPDAEISPSTLFAALVAFDQLRFPLLFYPMALAQLAQARVSAARLETFLHMSEVGKGEKVGGGHYQRENEEGSRAGEIVLDNASIYWSDPETPISVDDQSTKTDDSSTAFTQSSRGLKTDEAASDSDLESSIHSTSSVRFPKPILKDISLRVSNGELTAVVGRVGSGKSTLCSAILNETVLGGGTITLSGKVAYAAQSPWILNATLRDNILFGQPMDEERYARVIAACQLTYDLEMLEDGDRTEIGERGINLSGGQKARVSLARACYSSADTIILDDPLSALDPEVGRKVFEECIVNEMEGKTRLFVTNQLQFLPMCDKVVALGKNRLVEQGTYEHLMATEGGEVKRIWNEMANGRASQKKKKPKGNSSAKEADTKDASTGATAATKQVEENKSAKDLLTKEERNIGSVSFSVYMNYFKAGGGYLKFAFCYMIFILCAANTLANTSWVSFWTTDPNYERFPLAFYLGIYGSLAVSLGLMTYLRTFLLVRFGCSASDTLHKNLLRSILNAPQSFFDTTPLGRILSRFSKDLYSIDIELNETFDFFLMCSIQVVFALGTIVFVTPWFAIAIPPMALFYFRVLNYFREVARETKRLESISRSPVYAQFSETLGGLTTIRAYGQPARFMNEFEERVDQNIRAWYCNKAADRWLSVRLESIGACVAGLAAFFASHVVISGTENETFASLAGLSLTSAISLTGLLNWCVRSFAQLEAAMNACERVLYYTEEIPQEAPRTSKELEDLVSSYNDKPPPSKPSSLAVAASGGKAAPFAESWPDQGAITLNNLRMRYRSDTPLVLNGLSISIGAGERVGVVGRTGSGKSSLFLTLLRLVEPALDDNDVNSYVAPISIDGVDTLRVGLKELRSRVGIIPQNPVLFSGTIRSNLDPFSHYTDEQIWRALDRCGLRDSVEAMPGMLTATVAEYGENLSAGMRQMLVLGRALLKQCRILLLDEATSSVDLETDREIQRTIREEFPGCVVLTIAHRINTIMDSDKILVMKDGVAEEFAAPQELLQDESSLFSEIVRQSEAEAH